MRPASLSVLQGVPCSPERREDGPSESTKRMIQPCPHLDPANLRSSGSRRDQARAAAPERQLAPPRWVLLPLLAALVLPLGGCPSSAPVGYASVQLDQRASAQASALGPGDEIEVRVHEETSLSGVWVISQAGTIDFPLLGTLTVEGLLASQAAAMIRARLAEKYLRNPFVAVQFRTLNSKKVLVLGEVKAPGRFNYAERLSIVDAVTLAGGFNTLAERNYVIVTRSEAGGTQRIPVPVEKIMQGLAANFLLQPGDIVYVPETIL